MSTDTSAFNATVLQSLTHFAATDIGRRREENQDSYGVIETDTFRMYFVCDGMGGVKGGAVASGLAVEAVSSYLREKGVANEEEIRAAVQQANAGIFARGAEDQGLAGMGTTLVGVAFVGSHLYVVNVGDSRCYRMRRDRIAQLSEDHTLVRELIRTGSITPDQAENHPVAHMLTRSLGPTPEIEVDCWLSPDGPARGDIYLLCSDGLYNLVAPREMIEILRDNSLEDSARKLIDLANERGGTDNITTILIRVDENFPFGPEDFPEEVESTGIDDTVELYLKHDPVVEHREPQVADGEASLLEEATDVKGGNGLAVEDSPCIEAGISIDKVAAAVAAAGGKSDAGETVIRDSSVVWRRRRKAIGRFVSSLPRDWLIIALLGIIIGRLWGGGWFAGEPAFEPEEARSLPDIKESRIENKLESRRQVLPPSMFEGEIAPVGIDAAAAYVPAGRQATLLPKLSATANEDSLVNLLDNSTGEVFSGLTRLEMEHVNNRKLELRAFLTGIDEKLEAFEKPLSGRLAQILKEASREREIMRGKLEEAKVQIDITARKLSVWYGRQKRLQSTDPLNLATEVSVSSPVVREKKEIFERATWAYLQEAEVLRYNPANAAQEDKVRGLLKTRKQRMAELTDAVREAVESEVRASDRRIAELTVERDQIEVRLEALEKEIEYAQVIMGNDTRARERIKEELTRKRRVIASELEELDQLLPGPAASRKAAK